MPVPVPPNGNPPVNKAATPKDKPTVKGSAAADKPVTPKPPTPVTRGQNKAAASRNKMSRIREAREELKAKMARVKNK